MSIIWSIWKHIITYVANCFTKFEILTLNSPVLQYFIISKLICINPFLYFFNWVYKCQFDQIYNFTFLKFLVVDSVLQICNFKCMIHVCLKTTENYFCYCTIKNINNTFLSTKSTFNKIVNVSFTEFIVTTVEILSNLE